MTPKNEAQNERSFSVCNMTIFSKNETKRSPGNAREKCYYLRQFVLMFIAPLNVKNKNFQI